MPLPFILGAAAVAAAATGLKKGYDGYQDSSAADEILNKAKADYEIAEIRLKDANQRTEKRLDTLGELYLKIGQDFKTFQELADDLLDELGEKSHKHREVDIPKFKLNQIKAVSMNAVAYAGKLAGGAAGGAAAAYAVYGGTMALAAASTGTPIAALSGVAAYNATLAAIGGGSLAAGGLGMAGGTAILGGVVAAPVIAVAGWAYASIAEEKLEKAKESRSEVEQYCRKSNGACQHLDNIAAYVQTIEVNVKNIYGQFAYYLNDLREMESLIRHNQVDTLTEESHILQSVKNGYALAAILTNIMTTSLFKVKSQDKNGVPQFEQGEYGYVINRDKMKDVLVQSSTQSDEYRHHIN
ncbi:chemotaxis protein [Moraxella marmotae]|uniref:chemotaxis protein n=1 Tax=Moraxella marmotae TaxID=3344520 RepID=UPI0035F3DA56